MQPLALVGFVLLGAAHAHADAPPLPVSDQAYDLDVQLSPDQHRIDGSERIRFVNHSVRVLHELYFHLYLNAFANDKTVFMREGGARLRSTRLGARGGITLLELRTADGTDLLAGADTELIAGDRTQLRVHLPDALAPGSAIELHVRFRSQLPALVARAGFADDFLMVAQFFPKLARLEDDGTWASFPYHGLGEFYADFADYTLRVRVPARYMLASGGDEVAARSRGPVQEHTFISRSVLDVAFAAYPYFVPSSFKHDGVDVRFFAPRGYDAAVLRQSDVVRGALTHYAHLFGTYPYRTLTVVLPPRAAQGASGMEYPALFVSAGPWWALPRALPDPAQDLVAAHELAHQWFSVMLASHEVETPMLDEGLAQWAALDFERQRYTASSWLHALDFSSHELFDLVRSIYLSRSGRAPSSLLPAYAYTYDDLARAVYARPALVLDRVEQTWGRARLEHALGAYARQQRFHHPTLANLWSAFDDTYGASFAARQLRPALAGKKDALLSEPAGPPSATLTAQLLFVAQALMHWIGT